MKKNKELNENQTYKDLDLIGGFENIHLNNLEIILFINQDIKFILLKNNIRLIL